MKSIVLKYGIRAIAVLVLSLVLVWPALAADEPTPDPDGSRTGGIADIVGASAGAPTADEIKAMGVAEPLAAKVGDAVGKNRVAINIVWTLVCGFLVMFMQAGFAMAETGFTRAKNAGHTMAMNFMVYGLGMLGFWICGFALQMGGAGPFATLGGGEVLNGEFIDLRCSARSSVCSAPRDSSSPAGPTTSPSSPCSCSRWCSWTPPPPSPPAPWPSAGTSSPS